MTDYPIYWKVSADLPAFPGPNSRIEDSGSLVSLQGWYRERYDVRANRPSKLKLQTTVDIEMPGKKINFFLLAVENKEMYPFVSFSTSDGRIFKLDGPLILIGKGAMSLIGRLDLTITNNNSTDTAFIVMMAGVE